ncbi:MAG: molybdenum cofactor biosynthesis protein MoeB [Saprospiraceae bacterium]|nr:molybdenum cofactor biosynthesis protein MoeB [Saprospiraceae bacterium]
MPTNQFTTEELQRYARHFVLPDFGKQGQGRLKQAKVLVIGAGGLGSPVLLYLAAAGVGYIGIVDDDVVSTSNLQRQVLYGVEDIDCLKVEIAKHKLLALNPNLNIQSYPTRLNLDNVMSILEPYDIVVDSTDNFPTRYLVNDACVISGKINIYGSIFRYEGQVSVFNYPHPDGTRGPNYRDLFPQPPAPDTVPNCAEGGVLGVLPGIIGSMQANEVIKIAVGKGEPLVGRLFLFDAFNFITRILKFANTTSTRITELSAIEDYCEIPAPLIKEISVAELRQWKEQKIDFQLIDVREPYEYAQHHLGGTLLPLGTLTEHIHQINKDRKVVVHCKSGARSTQAIQRLQNEFGFTNLYGLKGGILAWENTFGQEDL